MKRIVLMALFLAALGCATQRHNDAVLDASRDGTTVEKAIIIMETTEGPGVHAEYQWLKQHYRGYKTTKQTLLYEKEKPYDVIEFVTRDGKHLKVYFDISRFFGKM